MYGLAFAYMELGDMEPAQKHFQAVLEMEAPEELRGLARNGLSKIAARELKARGPRMDAVFYPAGPCGSFAAGRCRRSRRSPSRSACWASTGWISTTPRRRTFAGAAGEDFPCARISLILSTFLLFYFPWRPESDGSN